MQYSFVRTHPELHFARAFQNVRKSACEVTIARFLVIDLLLWDILPTKGHRCAVVDTSNAATRNFESKMLL